MTVALMLERLQAQPWDKVLDVGSGSWWTSALLAEIVWPKGNVVAIETIPELYEFGRQNIERYRFISQGIVQTMCQDGSKGYAPWAPYDRILVSASAKHIPPALQQQLKPWWKLVIPVYDAMYIITKTDDTHYDHDRIEWFSFVPLVEG